ncbi:hypothetical protein N0V82_005140 [Gnomoniopsis sp. IMI 355080]|nr:hypothetical protein N0V82_005140 [Gnomoniopsis sp. IMI 355080]
MKLIVGGSTSFIGTTVLRQALVHPSITSIVALGRQEAALELLPGSDEAAAAAKLKSIVCDDFEKYSPSVQQALEEADACIWSIAVVPSKMKTVPWEDVCKVSRDYAVAALKHLANGTRQIQGHPFRFVYVSGLATVRNRAEAEQSALLAANPSLKEYMLVRGDAEVQILEFAKQSNSTVEACIVKPGMVHGPGREKTAPGIPNIKVEEVAAAILDQVIDGFEKDTLTNDDLIRIGQAALSKWRK